MLFFFVKVFIGLVLLCVTAWFVNWIHGKNATLESHSDRMFPVMSALLLLMGVLLMYTLMNGKLSPDDSIGWVCTSIVSVELMAAGVYIAARWFDAISKDPKIQSFTP